MKAMNQAIITAELDSAITFSKSALESGSEEKKAKQKANGRKAYDKAFHFLANNTLSLPIEIEISKKLSFLKSELEELGENF
jgi:hypothetical protein